MIGNLLYLLLLLVLAVAFILLAVRLWRSKRAALRFGGGILASLLALLLLAAGAASARGIALFYLPEVPPELILQVAGTPEQIARGEHIAASLCTGCHSTTGDFPLAGGRNISDDVGLPLGNLYPPNITPAGRISEWTDGEIFQFFRYARMPDGRATMMPVQNMSNLSDEDLLSVIAFLRTLEPVENEVMPLSISPLGLLMFGTNIIDLSFDPKTGPVTAPPMASTAEYGAYIVSYQDCTDCHGTNLDGVPEGPVPPGPNLRSVKGWTQVDFITAMRTGVKPGGAPMVGLMPWRQIGRLNDTELAAMYEYLKTLE